MTLNSADINTFNGANTFLPPSPVVPLSALIQNISQTNPMVVTVENNPSTNIYVPGQLIYLSIPFSYGMYQANALTAQIISVNGNDFTVAVNATQFDPFVVPSGNTEQPAQLAPAGGRNIYNFTNVPFRSLNGLVGN